MTIQEAKKFFEGSEFSAETKEKISSVLEGKETLDPYTVLEIKAAMQAELAKDFADIDISGSEEALRIEKTYNAEVAQIESDLKADMTFVEEELKELDTIHKDLTRISDDIQADKIRESI